VTRVRFPRPMSMPLCALVFFRLTSERETISFATLSNSASVRNSAGCPSSLIATRCRLALEEIETSLACAGGRNSNKDSADEPADQRKRRRTNRGALPAQKMNTSRGHARQWRAVAGGVVLHSVYPLRHRRRRRPPNWRERPVGVSLTKTQ
jgi:hypothetical protein